MVGIVSMQRAALASEASAGVLRAAQRLGSNQMEELQGRSFNDLVEFDFYGNSSPTYPFDDLDRIRTFPYRGAPVDMDWSTAGVSDPVPPGMRANNFRVVRRVSAIPADAIPGDTFDVQAIQLEVWVLWLDYQPSTPIPVLVTVDQLTPNMNDPADSAYQPYVQGIHLTTVRANNGTASPPPEP